MPLLHWDSEGLVITFLSLYISSIILLLFHCYIDGKVIDLPPGVTRLAVPISIYCQHEKEEIDHWAHIAAYLIDLSLGNRILITIVCDFSYDLPWLQFGYKSVVRPVILGRFGLHRIALETKRRLQFRLNHLPFARKQNPGPALPA